MSAQILRQKYVRKFVGLQRFSSFTGWLIVASFVVQIIISVSIGHYLLNYQPSPAAFAATLGLGLFIATRLRGLNNIIHECSHSSFTEDRGQNVVIGKACASLTLTSFERYKQEHLTHHAHLGDHERDQDFHGIEPLGLREPVSAAVLVRHLITPFLGRHLPYYLHIDFTNDDGTFFKWLRVTLVFAAVAIAAVEPLTGTLLLLAPFIFGFTALNYWADCIDHAGIIDAPDELDASRNIAAPRVLKWLFFPRNDSYHLVHHLFPSIPARHLEASHEVLKGDPIYASRDNAIGRYGLPKPALPAASGAAT